MNKITNYVRSYFRNVSLAQLVVTFLAITFMSVEPSFAQNFTGVNTFLAAIVTAITGPIGSTIAILAVVAIGFSFMTGRMDWTFAVAIIVGIAIVFGAASFVGTLAAV
jgi:type IV secretion system protein VirB2